MKTDIKVESMLCKKFRVQVDVHKGSVLPPVFLAIVVDANTEWAKKGLIDDSSYTRDSVSANKEIKVNLGSKKDSEWFERTNIKKATSTYVPRAAREK